MQISDLYQTQNCPICNGPIKLNEDDSLYFKYNYYCMNKHFHIQEPSLGSKSIFYNIQLKNAIIAITSTYYSMYYVNYTLSPYLRCKYGADKFYSLGSGIPEEYMEKIFNKCNNANELIDALNKLTLFV